MYIQYKMCVSLPQPSNQFTPGRGGYGAAAPCSAYLSGLSFRAQFANNTGAFI